MLPNLLYWPMMTNADVDAIAVRSERFRQLILICLDLLQRVVERKSDEVTSDMKVSTKQGYISEFLNAKKD